jgi:hypothetical protein
MPRRIPYYVIVVLALALAQSGRSEAMLELFQMSWSQVSQKMPEIAEAGYDSLWLPNPAKGNSGTYSVGYDVFDPFDLGSTNQAGTIATAYGTQADLINMVEIAHRFGIRVYFDNVMNHRADTVPGYPGGEPTNYYPGLIPQDFHLATTTGGYTNWWSIGDPYWCTTSVVENQSLLGLCDLANEPGSVNLNFGASLGDTITKPVFVRFPGRPDLYMDTNGPLLGTGWAAGWHPFDGHGQPVAEDVSLYLCRAAAWTLYMTKCDGFRLDAVKHVPVDFFGGETGQTDDPNFLGYTGAIQASYDYVHGYGNNVISNGYVETDGNRNSLFNTETARNDAMIFGEYEPSALDAGEDYNDYLQSGMRLLNFPLYSQMGNVFSGTSMSGMDGRDFIPPGGNCDNNGNFSGAQAVNLPQTQDGDSCCPPNEALENSYFFMHEGLPMAYSDGFDHNTNGGTPIVSYANYLGEFGDNTMPDTMYLHNQLSRGGTWSRWSDQNIVMFERYDYREGDSSEPQTQDVALFGMNDDSSYPGDISFDDGVSRTSDGYYLNPSNTTSTAVSNSRGQGIVVGFAPGSLLVQLASSSPTGGRAYQKLLVHGATSSLSEAQSTANAADPTQRLIYVGDQTLVSGGGAIELTIPSDSWVMYAYQGPQPSQANALTNAIILRQGGVVAPQITVYRTDGPDGDTNYSPLFPFKMRGSVDPYTGLPVMAPGEGNVSNLTYAIKVPIVTNANFDILVRSDASSSNMLVKLDGGIDLNSQMGLGPLTSQAGIAPTNFIDLRDNPPGYTDDVFLGYEQTTFQFRNGPEKFAARNTLSNNIVSLGAETYYYTVGGASNVVAGAGFGGSITNETAEWVWHDPTNSVTSLSANPPSQMNPLNPTAAQSVDLWAKVGYEFQVNTCFIYYTTDGSNPEGAFGTGEGTTQVVQGNWVNHDTVQTNIDWWKGTIPAQPNGTQVRYKIALFNGGSAASGQSIAPISDAEPSGSKLYGLTQNAITNFNPATAVVWLHDDLNPASTVAGLQSGFHILRARAFLPRTGQSSVYNTFLQTFYYDGGLPGGVIIYPTGATTISNSAYTVVVRADSTVTGVNFNIQDFNPGNDDVNTGQANGNGNNTNGAPIFVAATPVSPDPALSLQYTNYPQEFQFVYTNVPTTGNATIYVQLNEYSTSLYTNHYTMLTAAVNTAAQILQISSPPVNGMALLLPSNSVYAIQACYNVPNANSAFFSVSINGIHQSLLNYSLGGAACDPTLQTFNCNWNLPPLGSNVINVSYSYNGEILNAQTTVVVFNSQSSSTTYGLPGYDYFVSGTSPANPAGWLRLNRVANGLVDWTSVAGKNYQVLASTNLSAGFVPVSPIISATNTNCFFLDTNYTKMPDRFYQIQVIPP